MIRITYEFATEDEALRFLSRDKVQRPLGAPTPKAAKKAATAPVVTAAPVGVESPAAEHGRAALISAPVVAPPPLPGIMPPPAPVKAAPKAPNAPVQAVAEVNEAAVRTALREVVNKQSMKAAAEILKSFGATSISQIKPEQYEAFVKACGK